MRYSLVCCVAILLSACAGRVPTVQTGPDAEVTYDGLVRVDNSAFRRAWIDPTIDLSVYNKIVISEPVFEYRAVREAAGATRPSSATEFAISDENRRKLEKLASEVFREELARSTRFAVTDTAGPDTLIVRTSLLDIVSRVPPEIMGRGDIYIDRVGEATLVLELVDSETGETLARAAERAAAGPAGNIGMRSNTVTNAAEVRRLFRRWAAKLREGLDNFPAVATAG